MFKFNMLGTHTAIMQEVEKRRKNLSHYTKTGNAPIIEDKNRHRLRQS